MAVEEQDTNTMRRLAKGATRMVVSRLAQRFGLRAYDGVRLASAQKTYSQAGSSTRDGV